MTSGGSARISTAAIEVFSGFLARREAGEAVGLEDLRHRHPELAGELSELDENRRRLYADSLFVDTPAGAWVGTGHDPLAQELEEVLSRLTGREASYRRYRVRGVLATGGMGRVLRVYDRDLRRELAMKVLRHAGAGQRGSPAFDAARAARLLDEAQITAQLDHPGIPPVHEVGLAPDGELYFTMKLIQGERTLEDVIDALHGQGMDERSAPESAWNLPRILGLVQRASEAVAYAHERGVIHRDLKPANVLVGDFGEVYVTDWGVARVLKRPLERGLVPRPEPEARARHVRSLRGDRRHAADPTPLATLAGRTVGTPEYMSPEQAQGRLAELDRRSDVFSMGALLYHVLAGHAPFRREGPVNDAERLGRAAFAAPRPLRELVPKLAPELEAIAERAMAREPAARYADMQAFARDLAAYLEGRVVAAYETGPVAELKKWVRRNRGFAASLATALGVLVAGLVVTSVLLRTNRGLLAEREGALARESLQRSRAELQLAQRAVEAGDAMARSFLAACPSNMRRFEWHHLDARCDSSRSVLEGHAGRVNQAAFGWDPLESTCRHASLSIL